MRRTRGPAAFHGAVAIALAALCMFCAVDPTLAIDRTIAVDIHQPVEISLPPSDSFSQWRIESVTPPGLLEEVSIRLLPAETLFVFRPLSRGIAMLRFLKKVVGAGSMMSKSGEYEVEVIIAGGEAPPAPPEPSANLWTSGPGPAVSAPMTYYTPAGGQPLRSPSPWASPSSDADRGILNDDSRAAGLKPVPGFANDPMVAIMLHGKVGFPAHGLESYTGFDSELQPSEARPTKVIRVRDGKKMEVDVKDVRGMVPHPLVSSMLHGQRGFPANNIPPEDPHETMVNFRRLYPLPIMPEHIQGRSFLENPVHPLPMSDTPPGLDTAPPKYNQAVALARRGFLKQAAGVLEELIKDLQKRDVRNLVVEKFCEFVIAEVHLTEGNYDEARKRFDTMRDDPDFGIGARFYTALSAELAGDTLGAITAYQGVISHNPDGFFTPEAAYRIGHILMNSRAYERAIQEYASYVRMYPISAFIDDAIMDLAYIYDHIYPHQDFDVAMKLYDSLVSDYDESSYYDSALTRKKFIQEKYF